MAEAAIGGAATQVGKESLAIVSFVGRSMTRPIRDVIKHIRDQETYEDAQEQLTLLVEAARVVSASDAAAMNDLLGTWMALVKSWRLTRKQDKRLKWVKEQLHGKMVAAGYGHWDEDTNEYVPTDSNGRRVESLIAKAGQFQKGAQYGALGGRNCQTGVDWEYKEIECTFEVGWDEVTGFWTKKVTHHDEIGLILDLAVDAEWATICRVDNPHAKKAGVKAGDRISKIDHKICRNKSAVDMLCGKAGQVTLTLKRPKPGSFQLVTSHSA